MKKKQSPKFPEQKSVTAHGSPIAETFETRQPQIGGKAKSKLVMFIESAGGGPFMGTIVIAVFGTILAAIVQQYRNDREFQQASVKTRSEMELASSKEHRDRELQIVSQAYDLLGRCITVSDDLIYLTSPVFDPVHYEDSSNVKRQRTAMLASYNNCVKEWRENREKLKLLMSYYHQGHSEVIQAWQNVQDSVTAYMECAHNWYLEHDSAPVNTEGVCKSQREDYSKKVEHLNTSFNTARQHSLEAWQSPRRPEYW